MLNTTKLFPQLTLLAQVHDELVFEYDPATYTPDLARLQQWVESFAGVGVSVPLVFEPHIGGSWREAKQ
jgi:DNA polymerase I-like protein with 3'-5' exonuclease and polymerase domains